MPLSNATYGKDPAMADKPSEPVPVAEQKAAGVPAEETVTMADQKAGTPPPEPPAEDDHGAGNAPGFPPGNGPAAPQLHPELHGQ